MSAKPPPTQAELDRLIKSIREKRARCEYEAEEEARAVWSGHKRDGDAAERAATHLGWIRALDWMLRRLGEQR